jgi:hypothetical protein
VEEESDAPGDGKRLGGSGSEPAVILVGGAFVDRSENALAAELAAQFTARNYDRRGRGNSSDTLPYALRATSRTSTRWSPRSRNQVHLYGVSSDGALEAAAARVKVGGR